MSSTRMSWCGFGTAALLVCAAACGGDDEPASGTADAGGDGPVADAAGQADAAVTPQMESEPNDGASVTEFNELSLGAPMIGAIGAAGDNDIFRFDATPGELYALHLEAGDGSPLEVHLTAMDAGRDGSAAGNDYVKIDAPATGGADLEVLAMGQGGYFAVVRDARNVGGAGTQGSAAHTYALTVTRVAAPTVLPMSFPGTSSETLASPGAVKLYSFDGTSGTDFIIDMQASGTMDGRLILFSEMTGDWIARNDNRGGGDVDPLLDAPLTASGAMILAVENIEPSASSLGFTLTSSNP